MKLFCYLFFGAIFMVAFLPILSVILVLGSLSRRLFNRQEEDPWSEVTWDDDLGNDVDG